MSHGPWLSGAKKSRSEPEVRSEVGLLQKPALVVEVASLCIHLQEVLPRPFLFDRSFRIMNVPRLLCIRTSSSAVVLYYCFVICIRYDSSNAKTRLRASTSSHQATLVCPSKAPPFVSFTATRLVRFDNTHHKHVRDSNATSQAGRLLRRFVCCRFLRIV